MRKGILSFFIPLFVLITIYLFQQNILSPNDKVTFRTSSSNHSVQDGQARDQEIHNSEAESAPLYHLIGENAQKVIALFGEPNRIDASEYDYDWWIYKESLSRYFQIGIEDGKVVTIVVMGEDLNIAPFEIGQTLDSLHNVVNFSEKKAFEVEKNSYQFELTEDELKTVPLIQYDAVWAQINMDKYTEKISSIRFLDEKTLVKIRPYNLVYRGELLSAHPIAQEKWEYIEKGKAQQILDMTNIIRNRYGLKPVNWDETTAMVAYRHSREMYEEQYFSHDSPVNGDLSNRLLNGGVIFKVAGENIAARYVDAISAVEGWLNSEGHRKTLLNEEYTHLGVGVYEKYYTQNFIKAW